MQLQAAKDETASAHARCEVVKKKAQTKDTEINNLKGEVGKLETANGNLQEGFVQLVRMIAPSGWKDVFHDFCNILANFVVSKNKIRSKK